MPKQNEKEAFSIMALTKSSKILISDINTALSAKQDNLGYTPIKSVNGKTGQNITISSVTATPNIAMLGCGDVSGRTAHNFTYSHQESDEAYIYKFPSGGTWVYADIFWYGDKLECKVVNVAGGASVRLLERNMIITIRVA